MTYEIIKSLHLISVICWFAGLFYLPRLFVYHVENVSDKKSTEMLATMERRLYTFIMQPAMAATWVFGLWLIVLQPAWLTGQGWLHAKITLVVLLTGFHHVCNTYRKKLENGTCTKSSKFFRIFNEIPTILLILIVFLVILKPF